MVVTSTSAKPLHLADRLGIWASALCVVHCLLTPVLLSASAVAASLLPGEEATHRSLAVVVSLLGVVALLRGFRLHRRALILVLVACGVSCLAGGAWFGDQLPSHAWEFAVTMTGSALMIAAHRLNHTFCKQCTCVGRCRPMAALPGTTRPS